TIGGRVSLASPDGGIGFVFTGTEGGGSFAGGETGSAGKGTPVLVAAMEEGSGSEEVVVVPVIATGVAASAFGSAAGGGDETAFGSMDWACGTAAAGPFGAFTIGCCVPPAG